MSKKIINIVTPKTFTIQSTGEPYSANDEGNVVDLQYEIQNVDADPTQYDKILINQIIDNEIGREFINCVFQKYDSYYFYGMGENLSSGDYFLMNMKNFEYNSENHTCRVLITVINWTL